MLNPARRCLACNALDPINRNDAIWPLGWRCPACGHAVAQDGGIPLFAPELANTISGFDPDVFDELAEMEAGYFWFVTRGELIKGLATRFFPEARRFLEVGCGTGAVLRELAASRDWEKLVGSELHPAGLAHARKRLPAGTEFVQMDARDIPAVEAFDLTGAFDVIEHIVDDEAVLRALRRATQKGGGTIIAVPQHPWLWGPSDEIAHHERRYRLGELEEKLKRSGFEILFSSSFMTLLLPVMAASRLARTGRKPSDDIFHEFRLSPLLNRAFTAISRAEIRMTLSGIRWPIGGSRVVVGRAV